MGKPSYDNRTGGPIHPRIPADDNLERLVCDYCGFINYINPKIIVGAVCTWDEKFLLCKRSINPRKGYWTIPTGYMEERETTIEGAMREAMEEAYAVVEIDSLLGVYSIPRISQVQLIYRARLVNPNVSPGPESEEVGLFPWSEIPWESIAFPSVRWALGHFREVEGKTNFAPKSEGAMNL
ncbi:MAG: NUDIX hydrolase [Rhodospirillaceae bacterium]|nr:NUDIX hydrolase [Rhodospirillaceae bacterium]